MVATRGDAEPLEPSAITSGIPQDGFSLGEPEAPVTLVEYADFQCPFCRQFDVEVLPGLVDRYVRSGDLRLELRGLAFIGADSRKALEHVVAAAEDDKAWDYADLLFHNQGPENAGWVTDELLDRIAETVGTDPAAVRTRAAAPSVDETIQEHQESASGLGINSTPSFLIGPTGGDLRVITVEALALDEFVPIIDAELADARRS